MKLNLILGVLMAISIHLFSATPTAGQSIHSTLVTIEVHNETLKRALDELQTASGYSIFYPSEKVNAKRHIELEGVTRSIAQTLDILLEGTGLQYQQNGNNIVLYTLREPGPEVESDLEQQSGDLGQQMLKVSGIIKDENGAPLPGVTVMIKDWNRIKKDISLSTASDQNGHFGIMVPSRETVLVFRFVGYEVIEKKVGDNPEMEIRLVPDAESLEDVMVTGYQTISKERSTGSFSIVTEKDLEHKRLSSLSSILEGEIAGYADGLVRGTTSMNGMTTPLFVIDGFPVEHTRYSSLGNLVETLPELNLEDIESITVLKDAAAASIYGARAANGVIVITTKRAKKGSPTVSFSSNLAVTPYRFHTERLTNSADIIALEKEWARNNPHLQGAGAADYALSLKENAVYTSQGINAILDYYSGGSTQADLDQILDQLGSAGYRYYEDIARYAKRNSLAQQYHIGIGKASDNNSFNASVRYTRNRLENVSEKDQTLGLSLKNTTNITSWLSLDLGTYLNYNRMTAQTYDVFAPGFSYMPYDRLMGADGIPYTSTAASRLSQDTRDILAQHNMYSMDLTPLEELDRNAGNTKNFSNRTYGKINVKFTDWLKYHVMFQYETATDRYSQLSDKYGYSVRSMVNHLASYSPAEGLIYNLPYGDIQYLQTQYHNAYNLRQQLDFDKDFGGRHSIRAILGSETRHSKVEYQHQRYYGYDPDMLSSTAIDAASLANVQTLLGGRFSTRDLSYERELVNRFVSFYGNAAYTLDAKYTLSGSLRWDRSNLWGTNSKYQNKPLWSLGAAWNLHQENFVQQAWINALKIRASYGIGGNIAKDSAPYMTAYYNPNTTVGGTQGTISSRPNPLLSWEKTTTTNIGIDFSFLDNRVGGSLDYYNKAGRDLLANTMGVPTEGFGYSTYSINNGQMRNRGAELSLSVEAVRRSDFSWNTSLIYGYNKNKVTYVNVEAPVYFLQLDHPQAYPRIGNAYNAIYGYPWAGLSEDGLPQVYNELGEKVTSQPQNLEAIEYLGSTIPVHSGSFRNTFRYKAFELSFQLLFQMGHKLRDTDLPFLNSAWSGAMGSYITQIAPVNKAIVDRWQQPGDEAFTDIPRVVFAEDPDYLYDSYGVYSNASINVLDASFLRLNNVALAYRLPQTFLQKTHMKSARIQFNLENVHTFTFDKKARYMLGAYRAPSFVAGIYVDF